MSRRHEAQRQGYTPPHLAEKILRSRRALEGERRHVTVLFADIPGFTPLAEADCREALRIARQISYPTLIW